MDDDSGCCWVNAASSPLWLGQAVTNCANWWRERSDICRHIAHCILSTLKRLIVNPVLDTKNKYISILFSFDTHLLVNSYLNCRVSTMGSVGSGKNFHGLGWVGCKNLAWVWLGSEKSDPCPTLRERERERDGAGTDLTGRRLS